MKSKNFSNCLSLFARGLCWVFLTHTKLGQKSRDTVPLKKCMSEFYNSLKSYQPRFTVGVQWPKLWHQHGASGRNTVHIAPPPPSPVIWTLNLYSTNFIIRQIPSMFSRSTSLSDDVEKSKKFFTVERGMWFWSRFEFFAFLEILSYNYYYYNLAFSYFFKFLGQLSNFNQDVFKTFLKNTIHYSTTIIFLQIQESV